MEQPVDLVHDLSAFELTELYYMQRSAITDDVTLFMTVLFGYIVAAYLVADRLTKPEAIAISLLYSVFALFAIQDLTIMFVAATDTTEALLGPVSTPVTYGAPVMFVLCWLYSLWFFCKRFGRSGDA